MMVNIKITVFRNVAPCRLVGRDQHCGGACSSVFKVNEEEVGGSRLISIHHIVTCTLWLASEATREVTW
jgi:hypothetical protein